MKHLYVLMSWPEDMDMLWIKFLSFVSVFCSANLSCSMIVHIFKDKHKVAGDINSLNLLVFYHLLNFSFVRALGVLGRKGIKVNRQWEVSWGNISVLDQSF